MRLTIAQKIFLSGGLLVLYSLSYCLQAHLLISWDVSWGLHEAARMLAGGKNGIDYVEPSPPMFLYIYALPIYIAKWFSLSLPTVMQFYILAGITFSCCICAALFRFIFAAEETWLAVWLLLAIAASFLLLALRLDAGQREHFCIILTVPYFFLAGVRWQGIQRCPLSPRDGAYKQERNFRVPQRKFLQKIKVPTRLAVLIGLMAGIGFGIKPFFCIPLILVESCLLFVLKPARALTRPEFIALCALLIAYTLFSFIFHPTYFTLIIPMLMHFYYQSYGISWDSIIVFPAFLFCLFSLLMYISTYTINRYLGISTILIIAITGFALSYVLQRNNWYYHLLPVYTLNFITVSFLFLLFITKKDWQMRDNVVTLLLALIMSHFQFMQDLQQTTFTLDAVYDYIFFAIVAVLMLYYGGVKTKIGLVIKSSMVICAVILFSFLALQDAWHAQHYWLTIIFTALCVGALANKEKAKTMCVTLLAISLFIFPYQFAHGKYLMSLGYARDRAPLIQFLASHAAHQPVYFFGCFLSSAYPSVDYGNALPVSRYAVLFWLPGFLKQMESPALSETKKATLKQENNRYVDIIMQELQTQKPRYVFVERFTQPALAGYFAIDYIRYFSTFPVFKPIWKQYHYVATIKGDGLLRFDAYERSA